MEDQRAGNWQWTVTYAKHTGTTERECKAYLGFGFFSAAFLQLIDCPHEGEALIRSRRESTSGRSGGAIVGLISI